MVHRDIKPGNLLLDRFGIIKILDMGLARFFNKPVDNVTEKYDDKCVLGTADYLAPEQAVSSNVDVRADIYSLGGTLYFMLTGQTPFPDGTIASKLVAHQTREPKPIEEFRSDVPAGVMAVLRKMMAKEPEERYQTPVEVAVALAEWGEAPIGPPPVKEMPALCPFVLNLAGHNVERQVPAPLSRVLFGPGQGVFSKTGSGIAGGRGSGREQGSSGKYPTGPGSKSRPTGGSDRTRIPDDTPNDPAYIGPKSTERASAIPTGALPMIKKPKADPTPSKGSSRKSSAAVRPEFPSQSILGIRLTAQMQWILMGAVGVMLFMAGALAVYLITKT
jgi:serine/threonine protein kinase